jgi:long-chain fatty acid transport protein
MPAHAQIGALFTGAGPVNLSMGGASVAAPIDASGALFWNPASISGLPSSSMDFGVELLYPQTRLSSSLPANAFGPGIPGAAVSGSSRGDDGVFPLPTMALVYRPDDSMFTYGLGVFTLGGFGVNYPSSATNPILTPQPPNGFGLGSIYSELQLLQLVPMVSAQVTDRLSIGGGPTVTMANLRADPLFVTAPNPTGSYPAGTHSRLSWGGGFQVGVYYSLDKDWHFGASFKSPQWLESFHFQAVDLRGLPNNTTANFDIPLVASVGVGYTGFEGWTLAADFRYIDYAGTQGFRQSGFAPDGTVRGLGWRDVFALSLGAQYKVTDDLAVRVGYSYNQNPISDAQSSFNVASPTILEHAVYCGFSYSVSDALSLNLSYLHGFENSVAGPLVTPFGPVPGSSVRNTTSGDALMVGATVRFGGSNN